jgi:hypothetical protein
MQETNDAPNLILYTLITGAIFEFIYFYYIQLHEDTFYKKNSQ